MPAHPQARPPAPQRRSRPCRWTPTPAAFVAPRPRNAGTPSPEALARLQAAVSKARPPQQPSPAPPRRRPSNAAAGQTGRSAERPRFGIGSLINRMAGGHAEPAPERQNPARNQPPVTGYDDEQEISADQERIEIPAFLRRQAN